MGMTARTISKLDTDKMRKVHALMIGGATPGERAAAQARGAALARKAGMTLQQALSKLDAAPPQPQASVNPFAGFDDWMEAKEPGWKARKAVERAEREAKRLARCRELLAEFGSEDAVFAATALEEALREALAPLRDPQNSIWGWVGCQPHDSLTFATENFFAVRHADGRFGALLELEYDDGCAPEPEEIAALRAGTVAPGEFHYVPPGGDETFNGRAAVWVFMPGRFFDVGALEASAAALTHILYPDDSTVKAARACRVCGCTDHDCSGCIARTGERCWWVAADLCSACAARTEAHGPQDTAATRGVA